MAAGRKDTRRENVVHAFQWREKSGVSVMVLNATFSLHHLPLPLHMRSGSHAVENLESEEEDEWWTTEVD